MNKDLVLREYLAIERTKLANERTLLTYVRTGLYFVVAGSTLGYLIETMFWKILGNPLIVIGFLIIVFGFVRYSKVNKAIKNSKKNIGKTTDEFIKSIVEGY